jgi:hypothetical protein
MDKLVSKAKKLNRYCIEIVKLNPANLISSGKILLGSP